MATRDQHRGVVEELAGIHQSWTAAALAVQHALNSGKGTDALSIWHDRSFWPALDRLKARTGKYQTMICTGEHIPNRPSRR